MEKYNQASVHEQLHPFTCFMQFLENKRDVANRLAEKASIASSASKPRKDNTFSNALNLSDKALPNSALSCYIHPEGKHSIAECNKFQSLSSNEMYEVLKAHHACFRCLMKHPRNKCKADKCTICKKMNHHYLLCRHKQGEASVGIPTSTHHKDQTTTVNSNHCKIGSALLPIHSTPLYNSTQTLTVFHDSGSNASIITHEAAERCHARRVRPVSIDLIKTGNVESHHMTHLYEVRLRSMTGAPIHVVAYGLPEITGGLSPLNMNVLQKLFPGKDLTKTLRGNMVDLLIGSDYTGLHPRKELSWAGSHLVLLEGPLGQCLQGSHPRFSQGDGIISQFVCVEVSESEGNPYPIDHIQFTSPMAHFTRADETKISKFIDGDSLGIELSIKCGGCKCNKCPVPGHSYSFQEEQELRLIRQNLRYDESKQYWITTYPWVVDPSKLPDNYGSALSTLRSTETTLKKDPKWASVYSQQITDMVERKVARKLSVKELNAWNGPFFYISHLAVHNPKSESTPVRIVFNSSQVVQGISLNSCLAKGPDAYINSLLGILLRWREGRVAFVGDIKKMYNSIHIEEVEQHCHRFLWRDLEARQPDTYVITRVNMGDKPAAAISAEAIYKTADMVQEQHPEVAQLLKHSTYVDDIVHSTESKSQAIELAIKTTAVLAKAGFTIKHWLFSGEREPRTQLSDSTPGPSNVSYPTHVLGICWVPYSDCIIAEVKINFSSKKRGVHSQPDLMASQVPEAIPSVLTRRSVLEQTMKLYDPLGMFCVVTLKAKCLLRDTWLLKLGWDDPLPPVLLRQWTNYFTRIYDLTQWKYDRAVIPPNAVGDPILVILSDASDLAYGFVAYIRWQLADGQFWCRFLLAKCRITPVKWLSTPQMELCGAVLSKRGRKTIEAESGFKFQRVYQIVDSETILCAINKTSTRFKVFEGVRIAEIQSATEGRMGDWYWIQGTENVADWLTRGKTPAEIGPESEWWKGPAFLYRPESEWDIKSHAQCISVTCSSTEATEDSKVGEVNDLVKYSNFSSARVLLWAIARVYNIITNHSFAAGRTQLISTETLNKANQVLIKDAQQQLLPDLEQRNGKYSKLSLIKDGHGIWRVGKRLSQRNPMTGSNSLQALLPTKHALTLLLMRQSHVDGGHRGRDATLARFRFLYWTAQGSKVAGGITRSCQLCRVRDAKLLSQRMGELPIDRLTPAPPFNHVMVDLFGPYLVRGEVQKRTSGKAYGILFTDLVSRAVHIEAAFSYDTESFLLALQRFTNCRGWPEIIYSDPGSQLVGAERELSTMWLELDKEVIHKYSTSHGTRWSFGPADSPWWQGAAESLIKLAKRAIRLSINEQRLSPVEFLTLCSNVSNILNERPLGVLPSDDSTINILTPNCQLLGRPFATNPGGWKTAGNLKARLQLVNDISDAFWARWCEFYAPTLIRQGKWRAEGNSLRKGDIVAVADPNALRGKYFIGQVNDVFPGRDGRVRKVTVRYKNFRVGEEVHQYRGSSDVVIFRSVQRLALLVPVDESSRDP